MKNQNSKCVLGIYKTRVQLEACVDELKMSGFTSADISVLLPDQNNNHELAHTKSTKAPEGATAGGASGAVLGGTLGLLVGIGALAIPGVGPFIAAGPIMATFAGLGAGGAIGGLTGALIGFGIPEYEAKRYEGFVKEGGFLLSVHTETSDLIYRARKVLERTGATDIASTDEVKADSKFTNRYNGPKKVEHDVNKPTLF